MYHGLLGVWLFWEMGDLFQECAYLVLMIGEDLSLCVNGGVNRGRRAYCFGTNNVEQDRTW